MFNIVIRYLSEDDEVSVVTQTTGADRPPPARVLAGPDILHFQEIARQVAIAEEVARYTVRLVDASRPGRSNSPEFVEKWVKWGAGLRASQALVRGAKARALMYGRYNVSIKDVQALAKPILRHRIMTNFYAESERINSDAIIERLIDGRFESEAAAFGAQRLEKMAAERIGGEEAVNISAHDAAVRRLRAVGRAVDQGEGPRAIGSQSVAQMDLIARDRFTARHMARRHPGQRLVRQEGRFDVEETEPRR